MKAFKAIVIAIIFAIFSFMAYVISEPIMCYYQDLPIDSYNLPDLPVPRWDERIKQVWAFTYLPVDYNILEIGCGNTATAINLNKRATQAQKHVVIPSPQHHEALTRHKQLTASTFMIIDPSHYLVPKTLRKYTFQSLIIHSDGQEIFKDLQAKYEILKNARYVILETATKGMLYPHLLALGFSKRKVFINLSLWKKEN